MNNKILSKKTELQINITLNNNAYDDELKETFDNLNKSWVELKSLMKKHIEEPSVDDLIQLKKYIVCYNKTNNNKLIDRDGWACCSAHCLKLSNSGSHLNETLEG